MRILITGGGGMLGTDAKLYFATVGHEVLATRHTVSNPGDAVAMDVTDAGQVHKMFDEWGPDVVFHAAAYTNVDGCERDPETAFRVNQLGVKTIALAAKKVKAELVAISTDFVFDGAKGAAYTETDRTNPLNAYGASKLAGEQEALEHCDRTYIVRTSWLYGMYGRNFPFAIVQRAREKGSLEVVADQTGTPTFTKDLPPAIASLIASKNYGIYHASNGGETNWREFAQAILARAGLGTVPVHPLTSAEYAAKFGSPTNRPAYSVLCNEKLERIGASRMRPWTESLDDFVAEAKAVGKM